MDTVLVCVAPEAPRELYEFWQWQFAGAAWEAYVVPVTDVAATELPRLAAVVAQATDWPADQLHGWLSDLRQTLGPRVRLLALLPRPPESYPAETRALWTLALGYGAKLSQAVAIVSGFVDEAL